MRGKSGMGWFYGFKLHLIVNNRGELLAVQLTPGNMDDRKPVAQIEHTRHRGTTNFTVNLMAGPIAYTWQGMKPSLLLSEDDMALLPAQIQLRTRVKPAVPNSLGCGHRCRVLLFDSQEAGLAGLVNGKRLRAAGKVGWETAL